MTPHPPATGPLPSPELNARLAAAHAMPGGPAREQRITELVLAAIVAEIGRRAPSVRYAEFDWAPYGGLDPVAFLDAHGVEVRAPGLAGDLAQWSSDLRSPDLAGMIPISSHGLFLLDLHTSHPAPPRQTLAPPHTGDRPAAAAAGKPTRIGASDLDAPHSFSTPTPSRKDSPMTDDDAATAPGTTVTVLGAQCPIRIGDEVTLAERPDLRAEVTGVFFRDGILECAMRTPAGQRGRVHPWHLLPADGASERWHERMRTLHALQRAYASDLVRKRSHQLADQADTLSRHLAAQAITLRQGQLPEPSDDNAIEFAAREFDEALVELHDLRADLAYADLIPAH